MDIVTLHSKLTEVYTEPVLNEITVKIIQLYKEKEHEALVRMSKVITDLLDEPEYRKISVIFSTLIRLYHPDKLKQHLSDIEECYQQKDLGGLLRFSHIFLIREMDFTEEGEVFNPDEDFMEEYVWDEDLSDGYAVVDEDHLNDYEQDSDSLDFAYSDKSFISALKRKLYGTIPMDIPSLLLSAMTELDLSEYEVENLEGLEYCKELVYVDLSQNSITDVTAFSGLINVQELYLGNNQIGYIDALSNLLHLKILDISLNDIDDISPLFELTRLEFVNVIGNKIPASQIEVLKNAGITVVS